MKKGHIIYILVILSIISCIAVPAMADDNTTPQDQATTLYNVGVRMLASNDYANAISIFDQALASNTTMIKKTDALLYTYQGKTYALIQLGRYNESLQTASDGLSVYPKDTMLLNNKGYALYKLGDYPGAVAAYDQALAIDNTFATNNMYTIAQINKGDALYQMGRYQEAVDAYKKALENSPDNVNATTGLALAEPKAAAAMQTTIIVLVVIVAIVAAGAVWYVKFRKPVKEEKPEKKEKPKKK